jgi:hypothetical protein
MSVNQEIAVAWKFECMCRLDGSFVTVRSSGLETCLVNSIRVFRLALSSQQGYVLELSMPASILYRQLTQVVFVAGYFLKLEGE